MDKSIIDQLVTGLVEPHIYAFLTHDVPRYLKVGDTYRPVKVRIEEWRKKGFDIREDAYRAWSALLGEGVFFRDYAVHEYLTQTAGMERITEVQLRKLPRKDEDNKGKTVPYSREFFRYADDFQPESTVVSAVSWNVDAAISDIAKYHSGTGDSKQAYTIYDVRGKTSAAQILKVLKEPRDNQKKAIDRFLKATTRMPRKGKKLLMYAVMRFGKTFTSLCCAKEMQLDATHKGARLVVVVSAKKDVGGEWETEVKQTKNFEEYEFLDVDNLKKNDAVLNQIKTKQKKFVLFLTLQSFLKKKDWLGQLFKSKIDLLIVDETHFAARAEKMGKVLLDEAKTSKKGSADVDRDDDAGDTIKSEDEKEAVAALSLKARVRLHLSGTPYRILMRGEFPEEDIVAFCQYTDIIDAQKAWDRDHLGKIDAEKGREYAEWDNPYYGFPQMVRFAFNPNPAAQEMIRRVRENGETCSFSDIFKPAVNEQGSFTGKFVHEKEVTEFLRVFNGSDEGEKSGFIALFKYLKDKDIKLCNHVVMVLPFCASCDAMEKLLKSGEYNLLDEYEVLNISGHNRPKAFDNPAAVKEHIRKCAAANPLKKTLTLTVNRMLTGSTVPEWDTMIFLKETKSPQEYDQAIFRLQSPYVLTIPGKNHETGAEETIRRNLKPQTLLVDFNPGRMFRMQEFKGQVYNDNVGKKGHEELQNRIQKELEVSPIIFFNGDKLKDAKFDDVVNEVRAYSGTRGVSEEVAEIPVDVDDIFRDKELYSIIEKENLLDSSDGLTIKAVAGEGDEFSPVNKERPETDKSDGERHQESEDEKRRAEIASRFRNYLRRVLFYVFLIAKDGKDETKVETLEQVIATVKGVENLRIATHIRINKYDLKRLRNINSKVLSQFEYSISRISELAHDPKKTDPLDRALTAIRKFGRIGDAEIITPQKIARQMVDQISDKEWKKMIDAGEKILDPASKIGEFAIAVSRKLNKDCGIPITSFKSSICAIATSGISYEFTYKVYELLGLDTSCIADPDLLTSYKLLDIKTDGNIDYDKIARILKQRKPFNTISITDTVGKRVRKMNTFGTVIGNPPYQENIATEGNGNESLSKQVFPYFVYTGAHLSTKWLSLITPSRWFTADAQDKSFVKLREFAKANEHFRVVQHFPKTRNVFSGVEIAGGVNYFVYDKSYAGDVDFVENYESRRVTDHRPLFALDLDIVISMRDQIEIIHKVIGASDFKSMMTITQGRDAFGIAGKNITSRTRDTMYTSCISIRCAHEVVRYGNPSMITKNADIAQSWKVLISKSNGGAGILGDDKAVNIIGLPHVAGPGEVCTDSLIPIGKFRNRKEAENLKDYLKTKFVRFMIGTLKTSQNIYQNVYQFVPVQDFSVEWTDEKLYKKYKLTKEEIAFIESMIKPME